MTKKAEITPISDGVGEVEKSSRALYGSKPITIARITISIGLPKKSLLDLDTMQAVAHVMTTALTVEKLQANFLSAFPPDVDSIAIKVEVK